MGYIYSRRRLRSIFVNKKRKYIIVMTIDQLNQSKVPIIVFDKKLEEFKGKVLFPEKLKRANEILAKAGLPKVEIKK
jgi:hypothetical protein